jgi:hypothetical protein
MGIQIFPQPSGTAEMAASSTTLKYEDLTERSIGTLNNQSQKLLLAKIPLPYRGALRLTGELRTSVSDYTAFLHLYFVRYGQDEISTNLMRFLADNTVAIEKLPIGTVIADPDASRYHSLTLGQTSLTTYVPVAKNISFPSEGTLFVVLQGGGLLAATGYARNLRCYYDKVEIGGK